MGRSFASPLGSVPVRWRWRWRWRWRGCWGRCGRGCRRWRGCRCGRGCRRLDLEKLDRPFLLNPEHDLLVHAEDKIGVRGDLQKADGQVGGDNQIDWGAAERHNHAEVLRQG